MQHAAAVPGHWTGEFRARSFEQLGPLGRIEFFQFEDFIFPILIIKITRIEIECFHFCMEEYYYVH